MKLWMRRRQLGEEIVQKRRLYLDARFWCDFCDAALGENNSTELLACLQLLRSEVAAGRLVCPVECNIFVELQKQTLQAKHQTTMALVDELSQRTVLLMPFERVMLEVLRFVEACVAGRELHTPPLREMWTRPIYLAGHDSPDLPAPPGLPKPVVAQLNEEFEAFLWDVVGFSHMLQLGDPFPVQATDKSLTVDRLNRAKADPSTHLKSLNATYWSEVRGTLDSHLQQLGSVQLYMYKQAGGDIDSVPADQVRTAASELRDVLFARARRFALKGPVPSIHIGATLYSRIQWDRQRPYKSNDIFDFQHAEAALPYCDAFATESSLGDLLKRSGLSAEYGCEVITDVAGICDWIHSERAA